MGRCLGSAAPFVDEIVLVDVGSSDGTQRIARSFGARVVPFDWCDNFSLARNVGLERASGEWILVLDADEVVSGEREGFIEGIAALDQDVCHIPVRTYLREGQPWDHRTELMPRLFRNGKGYRFHGACFERLSRWPAEDNPGREGPGGLMILNYGVLKGRAGRGVHELKLKLLRKELHERPDDAMAHLGLALELLKSEEYEEAWEHLEASRAGLAAGSRWWPYLFRARVECLLGQKEPKAAILAAAEGIQRFSDFTDLYFLKAQAHDALGQYQEGLEALGRCLALGDARSEYGGRSGLGSFQAMSLAGEIHLRLWNSEIALALFQQALEREPTCLEPLYHIASLLISARGREAEELEAIKAFLEDRVNPERCEDLLVLADIWCSAEDYGQASAYACRARDLVGLTPEIALTLGLCALMRRQWDEALHWLGAVDRREELYSRALTLRWILSWARDGGTGAGAIVDELERFGASGSLAGACRFAQAALEGEAAGSPSGYRPGKKVEILRSEILALLDRLLALGCVDEFEIIADSYLATVGFTRPVPVARILLNRGRPERARAILLEAVGRGHDDPETLLALGEAEVHLGSPEAPSRLLKAARGGAGGVVPFVFLSRLLLRQSEEILRQGLKRWPRSRRLKEALEAVSAMVEGGSIGD